MTSLVRKVGLLLLAASAAAYTACSNNPGDDAGGPDTGTDGTMTGDGPNGNDGGPGKDGSSNTTCEAGVPGTCDIVAQNCGSGMECDLVQADGGAWVTACVKNTTGNTMEGAKCTPGGSSNPCVAGLECLDDGTGSGRCSKRCCLGSNGTCGASVPEGYPGSCDLGIIPNGTQITAYYACDYLAPCQPFNQQPCSGTSTECVVKDGFGDSKCTPIYNPPGKAEKAQCTSENECASGMGCYGAPDGGGFTCQWNCYAPGTMGGPFDAGIEMLGAGKGGCPSGEKCAMINWSGNALPTWLGLCQ